MLLAASARAASFLVALLPCLVPDRVCPRVSSFSPRGLYLDPSLFSQPFLIFSTASSMLSARTMCLSPSMTSYVSPASFVYIWNPPCCLTFLWHSMLPASFRALPCAPPDSESLVALWTWPTRFRRFTGLSGFSLDALVASGA